MYNGYGMYNSMPTATQPYGYPFNNLNNYLPQQASTAQQNQLFQNQNTNMIFVSGIEDVKQRTQMPSTTMMYVDNDKPLVYKKTIDNKGHYTIEEFDIIPKSPDVEKKKQETINLSGYVKIDQIEGILKELEGVKNEIREIKSKETKIATPSIQKQVL